MASPEEQSTASNAHEETLGHGDLTPVSSAPAPAPGSGPGPSAKSLRKRTKTGCLTCRRRRIKCGEERPICNNCVKSKRNCDGYSQRVIFKESMAGFRPGTMGGPADLSDPSLSFAHDSMSVAHQLSHYESTSGPGQAAFPTIAPRPPTQYAYAAMGRMSSHHVPQEETQDHYVERTHSTSVSPTGQQFHPGERPSPTHPVYGHDDHPTSLGEISPGLAQYGSQYQAGVPTAVQWRSMPETQQSVTTEAVGLPHHLGHPMTACIPPSTSTGTFPTSSGPFTTTQAPDLPANRLGNPIQQIPYHNPSHEVMFYAERSEDQLRRTALGQSHGFHGPSGNEQLHGFQQLYQEHHELAQLGQVGPVASISMNPPPVRYVHGAPVQTDEEFGGSESDDDMDLDLSIGVVAPAARPPSHPDNRLTAFMALQGGDQDGRPLRTFKASLDQPNMLATYRPSPAASPLRDLQTARIFYHFITATAPSFTAFERHPANPSMLFTGAPVPASQQSLWTYTIPTMALSSPPLMHAILAISSLHISKLQGGTTVPSLKHYHMALRRVARYVGIPSKRGETATLAATLLLGFWEVMATEHAKWNSHLLGARQLLEEIDFSGITKQIKAAKELRRHQLVSGLDESTTILPQKAHKIREDVRAGVEEDVDEALVALFMGRTLRYDESGRLTHERIDKAPGHPRTGLTAKDIEEYEVRLDLFWWYAKQDMYQSVLSGNGLLSNYDRWGDCPPRAAIGRRDAAYGSTDHLILLAGRIANFSAKDQRRKRKAMEKNGGRWRPSPGLDLGPSPPGPRADASGDSKYVPGSQHPSMSNSSNVNPAQQMPVMYGMIPTFGPSKMPSAFKSREDSSPESTLSDDIELEAATLEAEEEWNEIMKALLLFEECLGPSFQPLPPELMQPRLTPFGTALHYKTYNISGMWALYNLAQIVLHRSHPSMPPMAMMAAGVAAMKTARFANEIGRIVAALYPPEANSPITPSLGAAFNDTCIPLFFAGVQYQDAAQRAWTITALRDISRQTGWDSIEAIASGCETAWEIAGQMGRGPAYTRMPYTTPRDVRSYARRGELLSGLLPSHDIDPTFSTNHPGMRVQYATGILGLEEDLADMGLN